MRTDRWLGLGPFLKSGKTGRILPPKRKTGTGFPVVNHRFSTFFPAWAAVMPL